MKKMIIFIMCVFVTNIAFAFECEKYAEFLQKQDANSFKKSLTEMVKTQPIVEKDTITWVNPRPMALSIRATTKNNKIMTVAHFIPFTRPKDFDRAKDIFEDFEKKAKNDGFIFESQTAYKNEKFGELYQKTYVCEANPIVKRDIYLAVFGTELLKDSDEFLGGVEAKTYLDK